MNKLLTNILEESRFGPVDDMSAGSMIAMEKFMGRMIWRIRLVAIAFSAFSALAIPLPVALL